MKHKQEERAYLREWRLAKGLTQTELAKRTGTVKSEISRLEKGSRRMTVDWMSTIGRALGINAEDLMTIPPIGFGAVSPPPAARGADTPGNFERVQLGDITIGIQGENFAVATVSGDDWAGTYSPGDLLVYDVNKKSTAAPGVFAFNVGGETIIRRVTPSEESSAAARNR